LILKLKPFIKVSKTKFISSIFIIMGWGEKLFFFFRSYLNLKKAYFGKIIALAITIAYLVQKLN